MRSFILTLAGVAAFVLVALVPGGAIPAVAQSAGDLDLSFGVAGIAYGYPSASAGRGVAVQNDGKIVVAGDDGYSGWLIVRLNADGTPDTSFTPVQLFSGVSGGRATDVDLDSQGRIVVTGRRLFSSSPARFTVVRLLPSGALDGSFGNDGIADIQLGNGSVSLSVKVQPGDDKIVLSGAVALTQSYAFGIARFNANGSLDTQSFGTLVSPAKNNKPAVYAGYLIHDIDAAKQDEPREGVMALQFGVEGQLLGILVGGHSGLYGGMNFWDSWLIARYTAAGQVDTTFGTAGIVQTAMPSGMQVRIHGLSVGGGRIHASGTGYCQSATVHPTVLAAYDSVDGAPVTTGSWGNGVVSVGFPGVTNLAGFANAVQADGKIVVGATYYDGTKGGVVAIRFVDTGSLDTTFGVGGRSELAGGTAWNYGNAYDIALVDGGILLAGQIGESGQLGVVKFLAEGSGEPPTVPEPPTGLTATAASSTEINLAWTDNSANEQGFKLERSLDGTDWARFATVPANVTSYNDTGLSPSTTYYYRVCAYNGAGDSAGSNVTFATTPQAPAAVDSFAESDIPVVGTVAGSYVNTHAAGGTTESITEIESGGAPPKRYSYLEHKWAFNVSGGSTCFLHLRAYRTNSSDGDNFKFAYSINGTDYFDVVTVTKTSDDEQYQVVQLPSLPSGIVYIRVSDTNRTTGNRSLDTITIDHMFIRSE